MSNPTIITGCALYVPAEGKSVWGDLWQYGDCFVFNAVVKGFDTAWLYSMEVPELVRTENKVVTINYDCAYFDRRGVVVVEKLHCTLNRAALVYLASNPDFQP